MNSSRPSDVLKRATTPGTFAGLDPESLRIVFSAIAGKLAAVAPPGVAPEGYAQRCIEIAAIVASSPKVAECDAGSIVQAVITAAVTGLSFDLKECYLVPYSVRMGDTWRKVAQFQIGYIGYKELAYRSGRLASLEAAAVRSGDLFQYEQGTSPYIKHIPAPGSQSRPVVAAYAIARLLGGGVVFVVLDQSNIEHLRQKNRDQKGDASGAWATDYAALAIAKAIKILVRKFLPNQGALGAAALADGKTYISARPAGDTIDAGAVDVEEIPEEIVEGAGHSREDLLAEVNGKITACKTLGELKALWETGAETWRNDLQIASAFKQYKAERGWVGNG
jgi:recombination protein RecT